MSGCDKKNKAYNSIYRMKMNLELFIYVILIENK